jgi:hypothetical protein
VRFNRRQQQLAVARALIENFVMRDDLVLGFLDTLTIFPGNCVSPLNTCAFACLTTCRTRLAISVSAVVSG